MIEFSKKEKRNDIEIAEFILSFSKRQTADLSKLNITSFSDFLEDIEEAKDPNRKNIPKIPEKENKMSKNVNVLAIKFPFFEKSVLNDINDIHLDINKTKIRSFLYN